LSLFLDPGGRPGLPGWNGRPRTRDWDADDPGDDDSGDDDPSNCARLIISGSISAFRQNPAERPRHESRSEILVGPIQRFLLAPLGGYVTHAAFEKIKLNDRDVNLQVLEQ
jgi:hypothetical protein